MKKSDKIFVNSFWLIFTPLALCALPLFFYHSPIPKLGPYSFKYSVFLFVCVLLIIGGSLLIAYLSKSRGNYNPTGYALTLIISVLLFCVLSEIILRCIYNDSFAEYKKWGHKRSVIYGKEARPNHRWEFADATNTTDDIGFRTHVWDNEWKDAPGAKIFVIGASSVFGYGLNDSETWPYRLEELLHKQLINRPLHVINASNNGHNSLQILLRFYLKVLPLKPTHVIFYENYNDVSPNKRGIETMGVTEDILFSTTLADYLAKTHKTETFYSRSVLFYLFKKNIFSKLRKHENPEENPPWDWSIQESNGALFMRNVRTLAKLCESDRVQLILTTFLHDDTKISKNENRTIKYYNQLLRDFAKQNAIPLIDLENLFSNTPQKEQYFFKDHYHPTKKGANFIAEKLADYFVKRESSVSLE